VVQLIGTLTKWGREYLPYESNTPEQGLATTHGLRIPIGNLPNNQQQASRKVVGRGLRGRGLGSDKGPIKVPQGVAGR